MSEVQKTRSKINVPPSLELVEHAAGLKEIAKLPTEKGVATLLWRKEGGVDVVYLHVGDEPTLFKIPPEKAVGVEEHPSIYTQQAGYPFEDIIGLSSRAA
ncbi:hypothetical protein HYS84_02785 [Candidatus Saccharibacteria bacterium]|nr:hypothetical protein [Candidatus Saccharibacteria bacterium]